MKWLFSNLLMLSILTLSCSSRLGVNSNYREQSFAIPVIESDGTQRTLQTRVCFPHTIDHASRVAILNHGSPVNASDRSKMTGYACDSEVMQWFLSRGYIAVSPVRRGYGTTGGKWAEHFVSCNDPDFVRGGMETARDIDAVVNYVTKLPEALPDGVVIVGHSAGGWGTIAYDSLQPSKVAAFINMAGGRGGHRKEVPGGNCNPKRLAESAAHFGLSSKTPMLWIYSSNDTFFSPTIANDLHKSFVNAGGHAEFIEVPPYGKDGHKLFNGMGGSKIWGPLVEHYLSERIKL